MLLKHKAKKVPAHVVQDPGVRRGLAFDGSKPTKATPYINLEGRQVMPTPALNIIVAKTLLEQDRSPEEVAQVYDLVAKACKQQEKANSQGLESNLELCQSTLNSGRRPKSPRDEGSRIGSIEQRRREARNRTDAISISSDHGEKAHPHCSPPPPPSRRHEEPTPCHRTSMAPPRRSHPGIVIRD